MNETKEYKVADLSLAEFGRKEIDTRNNHRKHNNDEQKCQAGDIERVQEDIYKPGQFTAGFLFGLGYLRLGWFPFGAGCIVFKVRFKHQILKLYPRFAQIF